MIYYLSLKSLLYISSGDGLNNPPKKWDCVVLSNLVIPRIKNIPKKEERLHRTNFPLPAEEGVRKTLPDYDGWWVSTVEDGGLVII